MDPEQRYRAQSLWLDVLTEPLVPRPPLAGDRTCDVAIVGGGYTGLWTAYSLVRADPSLAVVLLEAEICGFGASGRNGGFVSAGIAGQARVYETRGGREAVVRAERAQIDAIDEIGRVVAAEGIECGWVKGGSLRVALSRPQLRRVEGMVAAREATGVGEDDLRLAGPVEIGERIALPGVVGGSFTPHCARVNPAALARGLARACERRGVVLHERSRVTEIAAGSVVTAAGTVRAPVVLRATEAYGLELPGGRPLLPLWSFMLATEPLPAAVWDEIGWAGCETLADQHHHFVYGQRTPDDRIALGGRGLGYRLGGTIRDAGGGNPTIHGRLETTLRALFPAAAEARVSHRWGGVFGAPRDWSMSVAYDRATGLGVAGGYSGHGVVASSLAGRTLADLVLGRDTDLVTLPWVGHRSRGWEPEPFRWLGTHAVSAVLASADRAEDRTDRPARRARIVARLAPGR